MAGRDHVLPDDVRDLVHAVLAHRLLPSADAVLARRTPEDVLTGAARPRARCRGRGRAPEGAVHCPPPRPAGRYGRRRDPTRRGRAGISLAALTMRGRSFLAAGVTAVLCALVLDQRDLLRVGSCSRCCPIGALVAHQPVPLPARAQAHDRPGPGRRRHHRARAPGAREPHPAVDPGAARGGPGALRARALAAVRARPAAGRPPCGGHLHAAVRAPRPVRAGPAAAAADRPVRHVRGRPARSPASTSSSSSRGPTRWPAGRRRASGPARASR